MPKEQKEGSSQKFQETGIKKASRGLGESNGKPGCLGSAREIPVKGSWKKKKNEKGIWGAGKETTDTQEFKRVEKTKEVQPKKVVTG